MIDIKLEKLCKMLLISSLDSVKVSRKMKFVKTDLYRIGRIRR